MPEHDTPPLTPYTELLDIIDNLPLLVREKRRRLGLSLRAAERATGIAFATIARLEGGDKIAQDTIRELVRWVGERDNLTEGQQ